MRTDPKTGKNTIVFVEREQDKEYMIVGFQLDKNSYIYAPPGRIRIARFMNSFNPQKNRGYYAESFLHIAVKQWKNKKKKEIKNLFSLIAYRKQLPYDVVQCILPFV